MMPYSLQGPQNEPMRLKAFTLTMNGWPITRFDFAQHTARHGNGHARLHKPHLSYQPRFFFFVNITNSRVHFSTGCYLAGIMHLESRRSIVQTIHANFRAYSCNITQNVETPLHREPTQECRIHSSFPLNILYGVTTCSLKL